MTVRSTLLVATALALAAYAALEQWGKISAPETATPETRGTRRMAPALQSAPQPHNNLPFEALRDTIERPLFDPTRRARRVEPPPPAPAPPPMPTPVKQVAAPNVRLVGILAGPQTFALLTRSGQQKTIQVEVGSVVDGWQVSQIGASTLTLASQGQSVTLRIERKRN